MHSFKSFLKIITKGIITKMQKNVNYDSKYNKAESDIMRSQMSRISEYEDVKYIEYPIFDKLKFVKCVSSTRYGGVSHGMCASMNLGFKTSDTKENVSENYRIFGKAVGIKTEEMVASSQFHNANIRVCTKEDCGKGIIRELDYRDIDGLITNEKDVALVVYSADCVPVLFADEKNQVIGAAHCGWRGTYKNLAGKMTEKMNEMYDTNPENIYVAIGASIKKCCYEISKELYEDFIKEFPYIKDSDAAEEKEGKYYLDLPLINKYILMKNGIKEENILVSDMCTCCMKEELFSHRGLGPGRGIMASIIKIKGEEK